MRLAHKRKVQAKLQKHVKATVAASATTVKAKPKVDKKVAEKPAPTNQDVDVSLTTKQQQVFSIVQANPSGINPKSIGLEAGQEDSKAASWATGALKKLLEENLVVKEQASGNKVMYKPV
jgi:hypothetical protein